MTSIEEIDERANRLKRAWAESDYKHAKMMLRYNRFMLVTYVVCVAVIVYGAHKTPHELIFSVMMCVSAIVYGWIIIGILRSIEKHRKEMVEKFVEML